MKTIVSNFCSQRAPGRCLAVGPGPSTSFRLVGSLRTPLNRCSRSILAKNGGLIKASATSSGADSSQEQSQKSDRISQTLADLDALLGIEEEPEEEEETLKVR